MTELVEIDGGSPESRRTEVRSIALAELPGVIKFTWDKMQAEDAKPADLIAYANLLYKLAGMDQEKVDKYAGLPMVNITIGSNMTVTTTVATPADVVDVVAKPIDAPEADAVADEAMAVPEHLQDLRDIFSILNDFTLERDE